jgi:hypothetical protein
MSSPAKNAQEAIVDCHLCERSVPRDTVEPEVIYWSPHQSTGENIHLCCNDDNDNDCWTQFTRGKYHSRWGLV